MSLLNDVASDVVSLLNAESFSQEFIAVRSKRPSFELHELHELTVVVTGRRVELVAGNRSNDWHDVDIEVAVIKRISTVENEDVDPLDDLVEEIIDHLRRRALPTAQAQYLRAEYTTTTDDDEIEKNNCFFALVSMTYRGLR